MENTIAELFILANNGQAFAERMTDFGIERTNFQLLRPMPFHCPLFMLLITSTFLGPIGKKYKVDNVYMQFHNRINADYPKYRQLKRKLANDNQSSS